MDETLRLRSAQAEARPQELGAVAQIEVYWLDDTTVANPCVGAELLTVAAAGFDELQVNRFVKF